jgi:hypothetical protein
MMAPVEPGAVDPQQFLRDGYCVVQSCVRPDELPALRESVERILDRKKRRPDFGQGSRISSEDLYDDEDVSETDADADRLVRFCLGPTTLGVSDALVNRGASNTSPPPPRHWTGCIAISALVEDEDTDHGATDWHRDASSSGQAPLGGMQADMQANGVAYTQWNICLAEHGDSIFWLVPSSHRRPDSPELQKALLDDPCAAIPGGVPIELKAGDGVVYSNICLHWGSQYNRVPTRRTLHLSYRALGLGKQQLLSKSHSGPGVETAEFAARVPSDCRDHFLTLATELAAERASMNALFRAAIARDGAAFTRELALLHPGEEHRMVAVVLLSKIVRAIAILCSAEVAALPTTAKRQAALEADPDYRGSPDWPVCEACAAGISPDEAAALADRMAILDEMLRTEQAAAEVACGEQWAAGRNEVELAGWASVGQPTFSSESRGGWPSWESRPLRTTHNAMPAMSVEQFIQSWGGVAPCKL